MEKDDGHGTDASGMCRRQGGASASEVQRDQNVAPGRDPLAHLRDPFVQEFRQYDAPCKELGPILIANAQGIPKALGDQ